MTWLELERLRLTTERVTQPAIFRMPVGVSAPIVEFLASVIGALAAGALAKAVGGRTSPTPTALRALIVRKVGKGGAEPRSKMAQATLAEALIASVAHNT